MSGDPFDSLCWYDKRSPSFVVEGGEGYIPREGCACDPCFYGRDRLALRIIALRAALSDAARALALAFDESQDMSTGAAELAARAVLEGV